MKAHGVFQKLLAGAGSWEAARVIPLTPCTCESNQCMHGKDGRIYGTLTPTKAYKFRKP